MDDTYRRLWVLLRERLTRQENNYDPYSQITEQATIHGVLTLMAEMDAMEFLED